MSWHSVPSKGSKRTSDAKDVSGVLRGIDHLVHAVNDLEACASAFRKLGFTLTPRGRHRNMATGNYCIMFPDDYIELMGIVAPDKPDRGLRDRMAVQGEGLDRCAFAVADVDAAVATLSEAGFKTRGPLELRRPLELPEGEVEPRFRLIHFDGGEMPLLNGFICYHDTPEITRRPEWLTHANGVTRVVGLFGVADDATTVQPQWERILGKSAVSASQSGIHLSVGTHRIDIIHRENFSTVLPGVPASDLPAGARIRNRWNSGGLPGRPGTDTRHLADDRWRAGAHGRGRAIGVRSKIRHHSLSAGEGLEQ
ncbi:MAG: VOC family protein [Minwuia sp.]|nr:VOC family protein [Minwuia sp.]